MVPRKHFSERLMAGMDLPGETLPGLPVVELAGDQRVLIEGHGGVTAYSPDRICVKVTFGHVEISGQGLELACMSKQQLVITGRIDCLKIQRRGR